LIDKLNRFIERHGRFGFIRLLFYPLIAIIMNPIRLVQAFWSARILINGKWGEYPHFNPHMGISSLFYWTAALNIDRYGRDGISPTTGLGNFQLSRWFMYSLPSLYAYWHCGAVTVITGMFGWWLSHFVWANQTVSTWVIIVMLVSLASTKYYLNLFFLQNYIGESLLNYLPA